MQLDDDRSREPVAEVLSNTDGLILAAPSVLPDAGKLHPAPRGSRRGLAVAAATAVTLGVGAGAWAVGAALSGGGAQPESVVPASAVFYAEVDLDPSAGQKVEAFRFLRKFPQLKDTFTEDGGFGPDFAKLFDGSSVDYAADIEPWLGRRFAVAVVPGTAKKDPARIELIVQATDEEAARASLSKLVAEDGGSGASVVVRDGYAIVAGELSPIPEQSPADDTAAALSTEAQAANLEGNADYTSAVEPYGSGVVTVWSDAAGLADVTQGFPLGIGGLPLGVGTSANEAEGEGDAAPVTGHSVAVLRFDGGTVEVVGSTTGSTSTLPAGGVPAFFDLPDTTLAAVGGAGVGEAARDAVAPFVAGFGGLGLLGGGLGGTGTLDPATFDPEAFDPGAIEDAYTPDPAEMFGPFGDPEGWPTLFGEQTVVALGGESAGPGLGVHVVGGADTVDAVLEVVDELGGDVVAQATDDGVVVASDSAWLEALAAGGGFGDSPRFRDAVPDAAHASVVGYVDIDALVERFRAELDAAGRDSLAPLSAFGFTATSSGDAMTFRLRLLTD